MRKTALVLAALLAVAGICVMLWPVVTGNRLQSSAATAVQEFLADRDEPEQQYPELLAALQAYNRQLYAEKQCNLTDLEACETPAADLVAYGIEDEIIGVLEIPTMELTMPVYLGASDAHLAAGAAVLGSTSAPIGGDNTNSVIAGHRGWKGADYFRHIDRLAVGDTVKELALRLAGMQYSSIGSSEYESQRLRHLFTSAAPMAEIDAELLKSTVSQVYVKKGQASLLLKNGQIIERS